MEQIERIMHMERILDESQKAIQALSEAIARFEALQPAMGELEAYYTGPDWRRDYDDDSAGRLPQMLKRGILSEDAAYNLLLERDILLKRLKGA